MIGDVSNSEWQLRLKQGSWLGVPLINHQKLTGLLCLECEQKNAFDEHHSRVASAFADYVAIALENARLFQDIQKLSLLDLDTGSFSSKFFFELAGREYERAKRYNRPLSMVLLRISWKFKSDGSNGFTDEKEAWRAISRLIQEEIRKVDDFARFDENSFIILLPESSQADSAGVIERLKLRINHFFSEFAGNILEPTLEVGTVECSEGCGSIQSLYQSLFASVKKAIFQHE